MSRSTTFSSRADSAVTYESDDSTLSGSDFTLYSEEALSDDINDEEEQGRPAVGDLITIEGKKRAPARPPPPVKAPRAKKLPASRKRSAKRRPIDKGLKSTNAGHGQKALEIESTEEEALPEQKKKVVRKTSRTNTPKQARKRSPQPKKVEPEPERFTHTKEIKKKTSRCSPKTGKKELTEQGLTSKQKEGKESHTKSSKSKLKQSKKSESLKSSNLEHSKLTTSISNSLSIEEVRAAGDGASEDNDPIDLRTQTLVDLEEVQTTPCIEKKAHKKPKRYGQSPSIDSQPAPSDALESDREETTSGSSETSDSEDDKSPEVPKSSQWLDFQAMSERISTTVKNTSTNMQKIADTTNITKLVGGFIKEELPKNNEGAWEKVDKTKTADVDSDSSHDFDDDYDPAAEADTVGKAFGDYKDIKKKKKKGPQVVSTKFDDTYNPEVDTNDPLASAFGDGFRTAKPKEAPACEFDDDFSASSSTKPKKTSKSATKQKQATTSSNAKPSSSKSSRAKDVKPQNASKEAGKSTKAKKPETPPVAKLQRPTAAPSSSKPARPSQPSPSKPKQSSAAAPAKTKPSRSDKPSRPTTKAKLKDHSESQPVVDLLGSIEDSTSTPVHEQHSPAMNVLVEQAEVYSQQPSNLDLLLGTADEGLETGFKDDALDGFEPANIPTIPKIPEITKIKIEETENVTSRSSSADLLDAFEFFTPTEADQADGPKLSANKPIKNSNLPSPQINIIAASDENLTRIDDLSYLESFGMSNSSTSGVDTSLDPLDPLTQQETELHIDTTSSSESDSDVGGKLVRDDTIDFDEIISRPAAENNHNTSVASSEVWDGTEDSGIGVEFRATFSVEDELESSAFAGNDAFASLIEKYTDVADGKAEGESFELGMKARAEITTDTRSVSEKRALKFARTFSETIDEDDDEPYVPGNEENKEDNPLSVEASTGLGLIVNPMDREDADGEENDENEEEKILSTSSHRHVWIDMSKPMPRAQVKPKSSKQQTVKPPVSSIKLMSQEARQALQVKVKPVPRPKGRELQPSTDTSSPQATDKANASTNKSKRLVTQGQADHLNLTQLREHTTLTFEIDTGNESSAQNGDKILPVLPPPPKAVSPSLMRTNPFNRKDSSQSEDDEPLVPVAPVAPLAPDGAVCSEINDEEDETECLIGGGDGEKERPAHKWEVLEKVDLPPLEEFRPKYDGHGWRMLIRKPPKKSLTKKRFWEEVYLRIDVDEKSIPCLMLYRNEKDAKKGAKELERARLNPFHQLSDNIYLQQYDQYGKCHSVKVLHVAYKERPSLRTDRVTEALPNFIRGYMKPNKHTIYEHTPIVTELYKFGSLDYQAMRMFVWELEDCLRKLKTERINTNTMYQKNEIVADAWDEYEACIDKNGHIVSHKARVRLFMLCFVSGMPIVEVGINDRRRRGKEIVRRHEIIPVKAENWITVEEVELHRIVKEKEYNESGVISFVPLDGSKFEFMRFRYRPKKNRELPLQIGTKMVIDRDRRIIELRADLLIPGYYSNSKRKGQVPCEDIQICFPIPDSWVYKFRVERLQKLGSLHAATRKPGKVKGLERITTAFGKVAETYLPPSFIECSVGDAKYEHIFRSVVWRVEKLPRFNEGAYKSHYFALRLELGKHDIIPDSFEPNIQVEFVMPHTTASGTAIRSISCSGLDEPPEKWVHHHAKYEYTVEIDFESEIKQLLPEENYVSASDDKPPTSSPVKTTKQVELSDDDVSSIEIDEDREDSDDTDDDDDSESDMTMPSVDIRPESTETAAEQGYATLLDINDDSGPTSDVLASSNPGNHLSELLDLTEVTAVESPTHSPKPRRASLQQDDLDLL